MPLQITSRVRYVLQTTRRRWDRPSPPRRLGLLRGSSTSGEGARLAGMMGAQVTRRLGKVNLEARAHREIGKAKPVPAPRHPTKGGERLSAEFQEEVKKKDDHLLTLLKDVYVESRDPLKHVDKGRDLPAKQKEYRPTKIGHLDGLDVHTIPKGTVSIVEALTLLNNHQQSPKLWTEQKISEEYSLELKDVTALITYFSPFSVVVNPPKDKESLRSV
ncbi:hypothetical protein JRQ81_006811 [Phrynocephalus forsythii]|uniref:NADH dehydrogenase [ubiquinone] 1 alpha subcomplex assembly factor 4 n=1 Tax=Phrynocephalus forsythii TaxID=171643 RepID=A0A9Q1B769_9SAUR|nr:hypothetical protein JRQ81_006811 [Phrynocephalus forsythii]